MGCYCAGYQDTDIMWAVNYIKQFKASQEDDFKTALEQYMNEYFNSFMINAVYNKNSETITLKQEMKVSDATHSYDAGESSMVIGRSC